MTNQVPELQPIIGRYLRHLEQAGREIATGNSISESTRKGLDQDFIPVDDYNQIVNNYFDGFLSKLEHPYVKG